jgi:predicted kinase
MELIIFIGLQASGKSTFYQRQLSGTHIWVSKDHFPNNRNKDRRQRQLIEEAFAAGKSVVVDNTHPSVADRSPLIALGRAHSAHIIGYYFRSKVSESLQRNACREGKARVADVGIFSVARKLVLPSPNEGFDEMFYVRFGLSNDFVIETWKENIANGD